MPSPNRRKLVNLTKRWTSRPASHAKTSYSQSGEDLIIAYLAEAIGQKSLSYLDIGAHHPEYISNTKIFYDRGIYGINVEPDPRLFGAFTQRRPKDVNLNIGVAAKPGELTFYVMDVPALNSFSKAETDKYLAAGHKLIERIDLPVKTITQVVDEHHGGKFPEILTIDVEGLDLDILKTIDYKKNAPLIICAETTTPAKTTYVKVPEIGDYLKTKGYMPYADTFINTIFVKSERWENLR